MSAGCSCGREVEPGLYSLADAAKRLGVGPDFLRDHADEFGVVRLTSGPKARLHFRVALIEQIVSGEAKAAKREPNRAAGRRRAANVPLIPIKGAAR